MPDDTRPSSMGQALEQAGFDAPETDGSDPTSSETDSSPVTDDPSTSDAAQTAASPTETPQSPESTPGPIPLDRHKAILDKAYAERDALKAKAEALAWAQQVPPELVPHIPRLVEMARRTNGDPVGFLMELAAEVQADPRHAASLKSHAARILGSRGHPSNGLTPQPTAELPPAARSGVPEVDAVLDARDRYLAESLAAQLADVVQQQIAPVSAITGRIQAAEERQRVEGDAKAFAETEFAKVQALPGFLDHREAIAEQFEAEMAKIPLEDQDRVAPVVLRDVWAAIALPKLNQQNSQALLGRLTAKAAAGSLGTQPTAGSSPQRPKSMAEALAQAGFS